MSATQVQDQASYVHSPYYLHSTWKRCNNMVVSWLVHSVSPSILQSILWMDNAHDIWKDLKS
ncbi:hypothetical protein GYH30_014846 [Glycine max]|nr:hypothetical protein GYH30_014846 [Glycine max]